MKLPDFLLDAELNELRSRMGISPDVYGHFLIQVDAGRLTLEELNKLTSGEGIDVRLDELTILPDGTLAYKDNRVLLYIRDVHVYGQREPEPRYHLSNCRILQEMNAKGKFEKYVVATENSGVFLLNVFSGENRKSERRKLFVCQICLHELQFEGFDLQMKRSDRRAYVVTFLPEKFFAMYPRSLHTKQPIHNDITSPLNDYPEDWARISAKAKDKAGWRCQECGLNLGQPNLKCFLDVHHLNGRRSDNAPQNLRVVCVRCHSEMPDHHHLRHDPRYREFARRFGK